MRNIIAYGEVVISRDFRIFTSSSTESINLELRTVTEICINVAHLHNRSARRSYHLTNTTYICISGVHESA